MDQEKIIEALRIIDERQEESSIETNKHIWRMEAKFAALIEILGFDVDQILDFHNLSKKKYAELLSDWESKNKQKTDL